MFCANCGTKQNEGEKFCPNCGTKFEEPLKVEVNKVEETNIDDDKQELECSDNDTKNTYNDECNNIVLSQKEDNKELNELIREADKNNVEAQMRLAVKYEFGLGVAVDVDKAQLLYSKIKENTELKSLIPSDINVRTGVVSDSYNIEIISLYHNTRGVDRAFSPG